MYFCMPNCVILCIIIYVLLQYLLLHRNYVYFHVNQINSNNYSASLQLGKPFQCTQDIPPIPPEVGEMDVRAAVYSKSIVTPASRNTDCVTG